MTVERQMLLVQFTFCLILFIIGRILQSRERKRRRKEMKRAL